MTTLNGNELEGRDTLVVGGTGNVGFFLVDGFLRAGARVLVTSRSTSKIERLKSRLGADKAARVVEVLGDIGTAEGAGLLAKQVADLTDGLTAVAAAPSSWHQNQSMIGAGFADFKHVIESSLYPHYLAAEAFLPHLEADGAYLTINGPAGFVHAPWPGTGSISVAAAAQGTLVQAFARETEGHPRVNDVVMYAYMGPNGTRTGSPLTGEQVGDFVAALASPLGQKIHGRTIHLRSTQQVEHALVGAFPTDTPDREEGDS